MKKKILVLGSSEYVGTVLIKNLINNYKLMFAV